MAIENDAISPAGCDSKIDKQPANEDESLAGLNNAIHGLLEQIADLNKRLADDSEAHQLLTLIINEGDRFKIWSKSQGLIESGPGCPEFCVGTETVPETILSFLGDQRDNLREVLECGSKSVEDQVIEDDCERDHESYDNEIMRILATNIEDINNRLYRLTSVARHYKTPDNRQN